MTKKTSRPGKVKSGGPKEGLMGRINRLIPKGILYPPLFFPSVLLFLEEEPTHGYELAKRLGEAGIVAPDMDPSVLYKLLRRLEEFDMAVSDHVEESGGPARKVYRLTDSGREALAFWNNRLDEIDRLIDWFQGRYRSLQ